MKREESERNQRQRQQRPPTACAVSPSALPLRCVAGCSHRTSGPLPPVGPTPVDAAYPSLAVSLLAPAAADSHMTVT